VTLKLLSYNIRYGGAGREGPLAEVIRACDPDLVVFQEATEPRVVERLAEETGLRHWAARRAHSIAYASRVEIARHEWHWPRGARRAYMEIAPAGTDLHVFGVHLSAVHSYWTERRRMREARSMLAGIEAHREGFHVLTGDFNTLAPGETLDPRKLPPRLRALVWLGGGSVRYQTIPIMLSAGYLDGYRIFHPEAPGYTFPTWDPHVRLDFFFLPAPHAKRLTDCRVVTEPAATIAAASDHLPLLAHVNLD
jgi:endonuclease/exonuclease/phosphatase family metal-dependent hydrolase